jgi:integrase/recombinase XerD
MSKATVSVFIDSYHPQKDEKCKVSIRITFQRKKRYYPSKTSLTVKDFTRIMTAKRRNEEDNKTYKEIRSFETKALKAIEALPVFTFGQFENIYLENREATDSIAFGFDKYIKELKEEKRIGTAVSYETAKGSLESFKPGLKFADITKPLLTKYENWMYDAGKSKATVGIYLRSLRTIFNRASIDKSLYPFGDGNGKYSIPTGRNIKKALTLEEIAKIFRYEAIPGTSEEMARDYWIFIYLCNGINLKDFCLLKRKNIDGDILRFERSKTTRSKKEQEPIKVSLKPEAKAIILKYGVPSIAPESYIFPHLQKGMTAVRERQIIQQVTKTVNKFMKRIGKELEISKPVTTYSARHSFATILKRSGANVSFISDALGHSSIATTQSYLAGFEEEAIHKTTDALTAFSI